MIFLRSSAEISCGDCGSDLSVMDSIWGLDAKVHAGKVSVEEQVQTKTTDTLEKDLAHG